MNVLDLFIVQIQVSRLRFNNINFRTAPPFPVFAVANFLHDRGVLRFVGRAAGIVAPRPDAFGAGEVARTRQVPEHPKCRPQASAQGFSRQLKPNFNHSRGVTELVPGRQHARTIVPIEGIFLSRARIIFYPFRVLSRCGNDQLSGCAVGGLCRFDVTAVVVVQRGIRRGGSVFGRPSGVRAVLKGPTGVLELVREDQLQLAVAHGSDRARRFGRVRINPGLIVVGGRMAAAANEEQGLQQDEARESVGFQHFGLLDRAGSFALWRVNAIDIDIAIAIERNRMEWRVNGSKWNGMECFSIESERLPRRFQKVSTAPFEIYLSSSTFGAIVSLESCNDYCSCLAQRRHSIPA
jgi:hypothetical protein